MQHQRLVLFTSDFPFGTGETFLETEIEYLAKGFGEVLILSSNTKDQQTRTVPSNCTVERLELGVPKKWKALTQLFDPQFWAERKIIKSVYSLGLSKGIFSTMLVSLYRAKMVEQRALEILRSSKENNPIFYSYWCDDVALGLALAAEKNTGLKTYCRIHRWDVYFEESAVGYLPFRHFIVKNLSSIISISQDGIDYANKVWKTPHPEKFELSRLGIQNDLEPKVHVGEEHLLLSCSNMIPVKRVSLIAEALTLISELKIKWVHFGDGVERPKVEAITKSFTSNIQFELKGRVPNKEIYTYYTEHSPNLFINVSSSEGVPVSIMEAMSFGISAVATDVGGNREIVDSNNGLLLSAHPTAAEIAEAIKLVLAHPEKSNCAYSTWKHKYNAEVNYEGFINLLKS